MGVIGIIYGRPNVTVDAAALRFKAGSACIPRGGKEAFHSSMCLTRLMRAALAGEEPGRAPSTRRGHLARQRHADDEAERLARRAYLARGGAGLIQSVVRNATVPVIGPGTGNCHMYVDASADLEMAQRIPSTPNASARACAMRPKASLVHKDAAAEFRPWRWPLAPSGVSIHRRPPQGGWSDAVFPATGGGRTTGANI